MSKYMNWTELQVAFLEPWTHAVNAIGPVSASIVKMNTLEMFGAEYLSELYDGERKPFLELFGRKVEFAKQRRRRTISTQREPLPSGPTAPETAFPLPEGIDVDVKVVN